MGRVNVPHHFKYFSVSCSNGQCDRFTAKIHGDHEAIECSHWAPSDKPEHVRNEHGDAGHTGHCQKILAGFKIWLRL